MDLVNLLEVRIIAQRVAYTSTCTGTEFSSILWIWQLPEKFMYGFDAPRRSNNI